MIIVNLRIWIPDIKLTDTAVACVTKDWGYSSVLQTVMDLRFEKKVHLNNIQWKYIKMKVNVEKEQPMFSHFINSKDYLAAGSNLPLHILWHHL